MSGLRSGLSAAVAVVRRDYLLFVAYRARAATQLVAVFFGVTLFHFLSRLVSTRQFTNHDAYFAYAVAGMAMLEVVSATVSRLPASVRGELLMGTFERTVVAAFGPVRGIAASAVFPALQSLVTAGAILVVAEVIYGLPLHWATVALAVPVFVLSAVAFSPIALLLTALVVLVKQATAGATFVVTGLSLLGGALFPIVLLPVWIRWVANVQPLTPSLDLLRHELFGMNTGNVALTATLKLLGFTAVMLPVSLVALSTSISVCRSRGTLIEY